MMNALLDKIQALDTVQKELETLGTELISTPDLPTEKYELRIATAYASLKQALKVKETPTPEPIKPTFNEKEERLHDKEPEPPHEEIAR